ncbi:adenosine receptor A2a-like [Ptychodera flava]|uniref:adenosine receptor A2a-like n=1 Tax=Ptychodera flava TaxID=63121 RepID=UPI00396A09ED
MESINENATMETLTSNSNLTSSDEEEPVIVSVPGLMILTAISLALSVSNILLLSAIVVNRNLHTIANYFYGSLTVAGLFISTVTMPVITWSLSPFLKSRSYWSCMTMATLQIVGLLSFVLNMLITSFNKYYQLFYPFRYNKFMTTRKTLVICIVTWTIAFAVSSAPLLGWNNIALKRRPSGCLIKQVATLEYLCISIYGILFPCTAGITFFNSRIVYMAKIEAEKIRSQKAAVCRNERPDFRTGRKSTIALLIMLGILLSGWLPFLILLQVAGLCQHCIKDSSTLVAGLFALASTATGPLTYGFRQEEYRTTIRLILARVFCPRAPSADQRRATSV